MTQQQHFTTDRLLITPLMVEDTNFILELVNTQGWIKFIGDKNIKSRDDALTYVQKILGNKDACYWTVKLKSDGDSIGIITFIKREYLENHDIGFAFLPKFFNKGYAYEATMNILKNVISKFNLSTILAITTHKNLSSIKLLNKMEFKFQKEIEIANKSVHVYGITTNNKKTN